jgi:2-keto-3-deoxy-L-rhamnonate aldolase RhmA
MTSHAPHYVYVVVRRDIPLEDQAVQACHAALEAGYAFAAPANTASLVLLSVEDEHALNDLAKVLAVKEVAHTLFFEPDNDMGHSALATRPVTGETRGLFRELPLWRGASQ